MRGRSCLLFSAVCVYLSTVTALPASPWASTYAGGGAGRRAVGPGPAPFTSFIPSKEGSSPGASASPSNPMYPFMTLKPYLPAKPANPFTPSFVPDPMMFVDKKAELLNNLFSSPFGPAGVSSGATSPGPSRRALGPAASPWATSAGASPWAAAAAAPIDPSVFTDKKADFLSKLFSQIGTAGKAGPSSPAGGLAVVPPGFWMPLPPSPPTSAPEEKAGAIADTPETAALKAKLLSQIMESLSASTEQPSLPPVLLAPSTATPAAAPKMIVPPSFWIPTDPLMAGPGGYTKKVSEFLDKLFASLNTTAAPAATEGVSARSAPPPISGYPSSSSTSRVARHHNDEWSQNWARAIVQAATPASGSSASGVSSPSPAAYGVAAAGAAIAAKDRVVDSILGEVGELKTAMIDTLNEMILKQKEAAAAAAATTKKPKFGPFPWGPTPKPTPDPTEPYTKRLETLGQVFDMLTALGREVATGSGNATSSPVATRSARSLGGPDATGAPRSVQMAIHQGYQSFPPGTEEVLQAGAGRDPDTTHEGGGLNLRIKVPQ